MRQLRSKQSGFSLLELILALVMISLLSLSLYASMNIAMTARKRALAAVEPARAGTIALDIIRQDLENAVPPPPTAADPSTAPLSLAGPFEGVSQNGNGGNADDVIFYCLGMDESALQVQTLEQQQQQQQQQQNNQGLASVGSTDQSGVSPFAEGVRLVEYVLRTDVNPPALVRRVTRNLLAPIPTDPVEEVLCQNVVSFAVHYYDGVEWLPEWDSTTVGDVLPVAVEVIIDIANTTGGERPRELKCVVPLSCAKPQPDTTATTGTGATP